MKEPKPRPLDDDVAISWVDRDEAKAANAQAAIDLAERSRTAGEAEAARYATVRGWFCIALGLLMGVVTPIACGVRNPAVIIAVFVVYAIAVVGISVAFNRMRGSTSQGWTRRYLTAFLISVTIYVVCVFVAGYLKIGTWVHWIPAGIAVALPLVILGVIELRRGRSTLARPR